MNEKVNRLQNIFKMLDLKQVQLATILNISPQSMSNILAGRQNFTDEQLVKFAKACSVNLNYYFTGEGEMFTNTTPKHLLAELRQRFNLSEEDLQGLLELLESGATREMALKFVLAKKGCKEAISELLNVLKGIQAVYE